MRVGVRVPSLLAKMRLKTMTETSHLRPSQKSSSGRLVSSLIILWEKIKVEGMYADKLGSERRGESRHLLALKVESNVTLIFLKPLGLILLILRKLLQSSLAHFSGCYEPFVLFAFMNTIIITGVPVKLSSKCIRCWAEAYFVSVFKGVVHWFVTSEEFGIVK